MGELRQVQIGHDSLGHGAGVYIETVTVTEKGVPGAQYVFPGQCWLDEREGDKRTWRVLPLLGRRHYYIHTVQQYMKELDNMV